VVVVAVTFSNYLLIEIKRKGNPLLTDHPSTEALAILGQLIMDNLRKGGKPVMVKIEGMGGAP
jgi:hypothetical protein